MDRKVLSVAPRLLNLAELEVAATDQTATW
jgi:hypothetical protein